MKNWMWKEVLLILLEQDRIGTENALSRALRTRRRGLPISYNGRTQIVPRAEVRDFLREILSRN